MKALVLSDIHDNIHSLVQALEHPASFDCSVLMVCGDICSPFIIDILHEKWKKPAHLVFGNNDGDRFLIGRKVAVANTTRSIDCPILIHGEYYFKDQDQVMAGVNSEISIAMIHYPDIAHHTNFGMNKGFVFYGHSHIPAVEKKGEVIYANPGSIMGYIPSQKVFTGPSFIIADINEMSCSIVTM